MIDSLTSWRDTIARKPGCRIPRYASFTPDLQARLVAQFGSNLAGHFGMDAVAGVALKPPPGYQVPDFSRYYAGREVPADMTLNEEGVGKTLAGFYHFYGYIHPLVGAETVADIEAYPLRDYVGWSDEGMADQVAAQHRAGRFVAGWVGHTYETAWQIRGYEEFLTDLMLHPELAEALLDRLANRNCIVATAAARAGVDYLRLGDDVANQRSLMFPPDLWRRIFKPRLARIIAAGRRENPGIDVWYHSDGNIEAIIPDLIEVGVTILNPVQPECMDPVKLYREYGRDLVLDGTIGTQTVMPFGTPRDVTDTVQRTIDQLGQAGGLILSPTHVLEPEVPIANIEAFFAACDTYGNG